MGPALLPSRREEKRNRFGAKNAMFGGVLVRKMAGLGQRGGAGRCGALFGVKKGNFGVWRTGLLLGPKLWNSRVKKEPFWVRFGAKKGRFGGSRGRQVKSCSFWGQKLGIWVLQIDFGAKGSKFGSS